MMAASSNAEDLRISLLSPSDTDDTDHDGREGEDADMGAGMVAFIQHNRPGGGRRKQNGSRSRDTEQVPLIGMSERGNPVASPFLERSTYFSNDEFADQEFGSLVRASEMAIESGVDPVRISQGSSGSYFVRNTDGVKIAVFKPKDEEPYGHLNPKWAKWFHKTCCPCCFGRGCIAPNQGYLSEAGASLVDEKLGLNIVPQTKVVYLSSESFHYSKRERWQQRVKRVATEQFPDTIGKKLRTGLRPKVGSFQVFVNGYRDAAEYLALFEKAETLSPSLEQQFQLLFEKLVILDYIIRNTDRSNENWLIKYDHPVPKERSPTQQEESWTLVSSTFEEGDIQIAAIDNGLSFPFKHPDEWRAYPFYWYWLPMAKKAFSEESASAYLPKLQDEGFVEGLVEDIRNLFKKDKGFNSDIFNGQMGVMRGQIRNLVEALKDRSTPQQLVDKPPISIQRVEESRTRRFIESLRVRTRSPFFKDW